MFQLGIQLHKQGNLEVAGQIYDEVLKRDPGNLDAVHYQALIATQTRRFDTAAELFARIVQVAPNDPLLRHNYGKALAALGRLEEARENFQAAVGLRPTFAEAQTELADTLQRLGRPDEALAAFDRALAVRPGLSQNHAGRADALHALGRPQDALESYDAAVAIDPRNAVAHFNRGNLLKGLGRIPEAIASYRAAAALQPDFAIAHHNLGVCLLLAGEMEAGLREYEWRKKTADFTDDTAFPGPPWTGEQDLAGKTLFIHPELFLGDMIQFCRYAPLAAARGAKVALAAPAALHGLLRGLGPSIELLPATARPLHFDYHCALMSLPLAFRTAPGTIPAQIPYLAPEPDRVAAWRKRIGTRGFRIGVCWQGSTLAHANAMQRSFPLAALQPIAALPGVRLISLQKHDGLDQLQALPAGMQVETLGPDFDAGPDAFLDTAAAMAACDLVISADTAVAHLAGALGAETWLAIPRVPDWRWGLEGQESAWYPTARLFRQTTDGDWGGVIAAMRYALAQRLAAGPTPAAPATPMVPVSWGELIDKITILEIKSARLADPEALANVRRELAALAAHEAELAPNEGLRTLRKDLARVNEALWDIEDRLRDMERSDDFGAGFVDLARSVYRQNDHRAALKRQINRLLGSELMEEKSYAAYPAS